MQDVGRKETGCRLRVCVDEVKRADCTVVVSEGGLGCLPMMEVHNENLVSGTWTANEGSERVLIQIICRCIEAKTVGK